MQATAALNGVDNLRVVSSTPAYGAVLTSAPTSVTVTFNDGTETERVEVSVPIGHRQRRSEGLPLLEAKFRDSVATKLGVERFAKLNDLCRDAKRLQATPVDEFLPLVTAAT